MCGWAATLALLAAAEGAESTIEIWAPRTLAGQQAEVPRLLVRDGQQRVVLDAPTTDRPIGVYVLEGEPAGLAEAVATARPRENGKYRVVLGERDWRTHKRDLKRAGVLALVERLHAGVVAANRPLRTVQVDVTDANPRVVGEPMSVTVRARNTGRDPVAVTGPPDVQLYNQPHGTEMVVSVEPTAVRCQMADQGPTRIPAGKHHDWVCTATVDVAGKWELVVTYVETLFSPEAVVGTTDFHVDLQMRNRIQIDEDVLPED